MSLTQNPRYQQAILKMRRAPKEQQAQIQALIDSQFTSKELRGRLAMLSAAARQGSDEKRFAMGDRALDLRETRINRANDNMNFKNSITGKLRESSARNNNIGAGLAGIGLGVNAVNANNRLKTYKRLAKLGL